MRLRAPGLVALLVTLAACGPTVSAINARPERYYQKKVAFTGRIARTQLLPGETLLELVDARGGRILVDAKEPVEALVDDWVKVTGLLVPEARVGGQVVYDVVLAEKIKRTRPPRFQNLF